MIIVTVDQLPIVRVVWAIAVGVLLLYMLVSWLVRRNSWYERERRRIRSRR